MLVHEALDMEALIGLWLIPHRHLALPEPGKQPILLTVEECERRAFKFWARWLEVIKNAAGLQIEDLDLAGIRADCEVATTLALRCVVHGSEGHSTRDRKPVALVSRRMLKVPES